MSQDVHQVSSVSSSEPEEPVAAVQVASSVEKPRSPRGRVGLRRGLSIALNSLVSLAILGGGLVLFVYLNATRSVPVPEAVKVPVPVVQTALVHRSDGGIDFGVDGVVIPFKRLDVPVEVDGRVEARSEHCRIGRYVQQGDILVQIASHDYDLEIRRIEEQLKQAEASLVELDLDIAARRRQVEMARQTLAIRQRDTARMEQLSTRNAASTSEVDATQLSELQASNTLQAEADQLKVAQATRTRLASARELAQVQLERAMIDKQRCTVRAPISGIITQEPAEEGVYLQRGATVATIQDVSTMEIRCSLNMRQMNWLWGSAASPTLASSPATGGAEAAIYRIPSTPVTVKFEVDEDEYAWQGQLEYFDGAEVDKLTRMVACRVYVRDPAGQVLGRAGSGQDARVSLMTGMFVKLEIHAKPSTKLLEIPEAALYPGGQVWRVAALDASPAPEDLQGLGQGQPPAHAQLVSTTDAGRNPAAVSQPAPLSQPDPPSGADPLSGAGQHGRLHRVNVRVAQAKQGRVLVYANGSLQAGDSVVISPLASPVDGTVVKRGGTQ